MFVYFRITWFPITCFRSLPLKMLNALIKITKPIMRSILGFTLRIKQVLRKLTQYDDILQNFIAVHISDWWILLEKERVYRRKWPWESRSATLKKRLGQFMRIRQLSLSHMQKLISLCMYSQLSSSTINLFFGIDLHPMTILCLCEQRTLCAIAQARLRYRCSQLRLLSKPHELSQISNSQFFVCVYGLRPSQQFFTCVGTLTQ